MADAVLVRQFVSAVYAGVEGFADVYSGPQKLDSRVS